MASADPWTFVSSKYFIIEQRSEQNQCNRHWLKVWFTYEHAVRVISDPWWHTIYYLCHEPQLTNVREIGLLSGLLTHLTTFRAISEQVLITMERSKAECNQYDWIGTNAHTLRPPSNRADSRGHFWRWCTPIH